MRFVLLLAGCLAMFCATSQSQTSATAPTTGELFTKQIAPGETVVISRQRTDPRRLGVLGTGIASQEGDVALLRADLRLDDGSTVLLAATHHTEYPDFRQGFDVLDVFVGDGDLVVACAMGSSIGLWRITTDRWGKADGWTFTPPDQRRAVRAPLKQGEARVDMSQTVAGRWKLTVQHGGQRVEFGQPESAWRFQQVSPSWP